MVCCGHGFVKEVNKTIFDFITKGKDKVLVGDIEDGGLQAPHLNSMIETETIMCYVTIRLRARVFYEQIVNEGQPS